MNEEDDTSSLSARGLQTWSHIDVLSQYMAKCSENPFHPEKNPEGIVNLGTCVNKLMEEELRQRFSKGDLFNFVPEDHQHYFDFRGSLELRIAIANFYYKYFNVSEQIDPDDLVVVSGGASCLDSLSHVLFDPGQGFITPTPTYGGIYTELTDRSFAQPYPLHLPAQPNEKGTRFSLTPKLLEERILELEEEGKQIRGFVLINPQNPLGDVYPPTLVRALMEVCAKYNLHIIINEVYVLSLNDKDAEVTSALSIPDVPDPQRTHVVWAFTKDIGLAGFRVGVIHTKNRAVKKTLESVAVYCSTPSIVQTAAEKLLNDTKWMEVFLRTQRQKLEDRYILAKSRVESMGIPVHKSGGGLFIWMDLNRFLPSSTFESETELFEEFFTAGVYILPGEWQYCNFPGWFRLVFSVTEEEFQEGLRRFENVLTKRKPKF